MIKYYNMTWTKEMKTNVFELEISHTKEITGAIADSLNVMYLKLLGTLRLRPRLSVELFMR